MIDDDDVVSSMRDRYSVWHRCLSHVMASVQSDVCVGVLRDILVLFALRLFVLRHYYVLILCVVLLLCVMSSLFDIH